MRIVPALVIAGLLGAVVPGPATSAMHAPGTAMQVPGGAAKASAARACQKRVQLGSSREGRSIVACQVRGSTESAATMLLVVGSMHGNEKGGLKVTRRLRAMDLTGGEANIWTIATINPDGHVRDRRGNLRRVDLNGNFPTEGWQERFSGLDTYGGPRPASEPETRALMQAMSRLQPDRVVVFHQQINSIDCPPYRPRTLTRKLHRVTGYAIRCLPVNHGNFTAWANSTYRWTTAVTFELEARPPASRMDRVAKGLVRIARG